jgi:hypothetical protein
MPNSAAIRGVTASEIRFGISAPFTGPAKELGQNMKLGIEAATRSGKIMRRVPAAISNNEDAGDISTRLIPRSSRRFGR